MPSPLDMYHFVAGFLVPVVSCSMTDEAGQDQHGRFVIFAKQMMGDGAAPAQIAKPKTVVATYQDAITVPFFLIPLEPLILYVFLHDNHYRTMKSDQPLFNARKFHQFIL